MNVVYYLVLTLSGHIAVIPEPIATEQACKVVGAQWKGSRTDKSFECLKIETRLE